MTKKSAYDTLVFGGLRASWAKERLVKNFLDVMLLHMLKKSGPVHGYELTKLIHTQSGILLSCGTLYPVLYELEKGGLIKSKMAGKRKNYALADHSRAEVIFNDFRSACLQVLGWTV